MCIHVHTVPGIVSMLQAGWSRNCSSSPSSSKRLLSPTSSSLAEGGPLTSIYSQVSECKDLYLHFHIPIQGLHRDSCLLHNHTVVTFNAVFHYLIAIFLIKTAYASIICLLTMLLGKTLHLNGLLLVYS